MNILLTGATGFIGKVLLAKLVEKYNVSCIARQEVAQQKTIIASMTKNSDWRQACNNIDLIIHLAGRVHVMNETAVDLLTEFREINTFATLNLAKQATELGVKRFIFISSIKVNGEFTELALPFTADDSFVPTDPYALSKYEAEQGLKKIADETGMEVVIIRPPLVYGEGVKANFSSMMKWINKGIPLPFGAVNENKRSLVSVGNLVDLIEVCITHPSAINQTFLISDDDDVSTAQLLADMATALNVPSRLLPIPISWLVGLGKLIAKPEVSQRLCASLQVDISKTKELLNWTPPYCRSECMKKTADAFLKNLNNKQLTDE